MFADGHDGAFEVLVCAHPPGDAIHNHADVMRFHRCSSSPLNCTLRPQDIPHFLDSNGFCSHIWYFVANMSRPIQFLFGQFVPQCNHSIDKHFDDYYVLQFMDAGRISLSVDQREFQLEGRWFWSSYPGPRISFRAAQSGENWVHRYLAFAGPVVRNWIAGKLFPVPPQHLAPGVEYSERFDELLALSRRTDRWGTARAALLLETILAELAELRAKPQAVPDWLEHGLAQITALGANVDYEKLAMEAGMSPRSFRRRFTEAMGIPPNAYAISSRIAHARQMLGATELPIKNIAEQLDYSDVFFFSRQFTQITGISPAAYRRSKEA
jgi:AraC-like DNA-binding protein